MTAAQLLAWHRQADAGDRIRYYMGNLGTARAERHTSNAREIVELADAARLLGVPQAYAVHVHHHPSKPIKFGQGLAHLTQRRIGEGRFEYFITKTAQEVLT